MAEARLARRAPEPSDEQAEQAPSPARHEAIERRRSASSRTHEDSLAKAASRPKPEPVQPAAKPNRTGLPDPLKAGVERLSGIAMDDVKVRFNSPRPAQLDALAFAQGREIHVAPGQERHLPHEAWHVVQQAQGRVKPTAQLKGGLAVSTDSALEREADRMGARALREGGSGAVPAGRLRPAPAAATVQRKGGNKREKTPEEVADDTFKQIYAAAPVDPNAESVGAPATGPGKFIVTVGDGSNHHVYPKSKLTKTAAELSKWQAAAHEASERVKKDSANKQSAKEFSAEAAARLTNVAADIKRRTGPIGITATGAWDPAARINRYYWLPGLLFLGVNSGHRSDDPGSNEEPFKPRSMPAAAFNAAKSWGRYTAALAGKLASEGKSWTYDTSRAAVAALLDGYLDERPSAGAVHRTSEAMGEDWMLPPTTSAAQYMLQWGRGGHQYQLNRTGANRFTALPNWSSVIAQAVRKELPAQDAANFAGAIRAAHANEAQALDEAYAKASSPDEIVLYGTYAVLTQLIVAMDTIKGLAPAWLLINPQADFDNALAALKALRIRSP